MTFILTTPSMSHVLLLNWMLLPWVSWHQLEHWTLLQLLKNITLEWKKGICTLARNSVSDKEKSFMRLMGSTYGWGVYWVNVIGSKKKDPGLTSCPGNFFQSQKCSIRLAHLCPMLVIILIQIWNKGPNVFDIQNKILESDQSYFNSIHKTSFSP